MNKAHRYRCENMNATMSDSMTAFCYGFGVAISIALAIAVGNAWVREHRNGVWTMNMIATIGAIAITFGLVVGWSLVQYFTLVAASATGRM
jgi:MFS family permease